MFATFCNFVRTFASILAKIDFDQPYFLHFCLFASGCVCVCVCVCVDPYSKLLRDEGAERSEAKTSGSLPQNCVRVCVCVSVRVSKCVCVCVRVCVCVCESVCVCVCV